MSLDADIGSLADLRLVRGFLGSRRWFSVCTR